MDLPKVTTREEWLEARKELLAREKEETRRRDALRAARRALPLVEVEKGEIPGYSVFLRDGERVFHTYSTYARGVELLNPSTQFVDLTPLGRQEA